MWILATLTDIRVHKICQKKFATADFKKHIWILEEAGRPVCSAKILAILGQNAVDGNLVQLEEPGRDQ